MFEIDYGLQQTVSQILLSLSNVDDIYYCLHFVIVFLNPICD